MKTKEPYKLREEAERRALTRSKRGFGPLGDTKWRSCLNCDEMFWSSWAGHRICPTCSALPEDGRHVRQPKYLLGGLLEPDDDEEVQT